jgi:aryl-alcohol dehydrogenase-like predicted oxidoreductase
MQNIRFGRTGLTVSRTGFGAIPIQRLGFDEAKLLLRRAYEGGITMFDTARGYSDSEAKIGYALSDVRRHVVLATKTFAADRQGVLDSLKISLGNLKTDYVDILQLHNPSTLSDPNDPQSAYAGLVEAKRLGMIRFIGITNHRPEVAIRAAESGLYDTLQFPLSPISSADELAVVAACRQADIGVLAMKALCGGLYADAVSAFAFLRQFENVVPIWGMQRMSELEQFLGLEAQPPELDAAMQATIDRARGELAGDFCRGCGYCLPCPADIPIPMAARMALLLRRALASSFLTPEWQEKMARIEKCVNCGHCRQHCPYGLDTPALLKKMYADYKTYL